MGTAVAMEDAIWTVAVAGVGVEVGGVETVAVAGKAEGVEPEQAATCTAKIDRKSIEAHRRLIFL